MIVISLVLVIAAAVSLFVGLFVVTDSLTFIFLAIVLCLVSLVLLRLGTRAQKTTGPSKPSEPVYGGVARAGTAAPARAGGGDLGDDTSAPSVVRKTTARDRAAARAADADVTVTTETATASTAAASTPSAPAAGAPAAAAETSAPAAAKPAKKAAPKKAAPKKVAAKKATKTTAAPAKKSAAKKAAAAKKPAASKKTTGAAARSVLAGVSGVGPAKQDALLKQYKNLEGIRDASVEDIVANVPGFGEALATRVKDAVS